ncbi:MAG: DUF4037 domain-containing protein [Hamadaea sp.]|nr:DUF4037 domain-containing protein [Hamadaea sp.]
MEELRTGIDVARAFHAAAVGPLLARELPGLAYAAGRLGSGSDVVGLDDATSRDHDWGCRLTLLVDEADAAMAAKVDELLADQLPETFAGLPVRFPVSWDRTDTHNVEVATVHGFAASRLGVAPDALPAIPHLDWLTVTGQGVIEVAVGPVFHDATRELAPVRSALAWYPPDVDRYVLASAWFGIGERLTLLGRTADRGQELQSRLLGAQVVAALMHVAFLVHRTWMPYPKWREAIFQRLPDASSLSAHFETALSAAPVREREQALAEAAQILLDVQRSRGLPAPDQAVGPFWDRPHLVVNGEVVRLLIESVDDGQLRALPLMGAPEQWVDSEAVLAKPELRIGLGATHRAWLRPQT